MLCWILVLPFVFGTDVSMRFVRYFCDEHGIKTESPIVSDVNEVAVTFNAEIKDFDGIFAEGEYMNIFQCKIGRELIASVFLVNHTFYGLERGRQIERNVIIIYSTYVAEKHRNQGYSKRILAEAMNAMNDHYKMEGNFILVLHVNPQDKCMEVAFSMYYNLNFRRGGLSMYDPASKRFHLEEMMRYDDPLDVIDRYDESVDKGQYLVMVCEYSDFNKCKKKIPYERLLEYGKRLRGILEPWITN